GLAVELAPDDEFLQIAAREGSRLRIDGALAHIHLGDDALRRRRDRARLDDTCAAEERLAVRLVTRQEQVLRKPHAGRGAVSKPFLRHEGSAEQTPARDRLASGVLAANADRSRLLLQNLAGNRFEQFALAVAGHAGD